MLDYPPEIWLGRLESNSQALALYCASPKVLHTIGKEMVLKDGQNACSVQNALHVFVAAIALANSSLRIPPM